MLSWLLSLSLAPSVPVVESEFVPGQEYLQVVIKAPEFQNERDRASWWIIGSSLKKDSERYTYNDLRTLSAPIGQTPHVWMNDEVICYSLRLPAGSLQASIPMVASSFLYPKLNAAAVAEIRSDLATSSLDPVAKFLQGRLGEVDRVQGRDLQSFWSRMVQPERMMITVSGGRVPTLHREWVQKEFASFPKELAGAGPGRNETAPQTNSGGAWVAAYGWSELSLSKDQAKRWLALSALGTGMGSSLHRVVRDLHGLTYLQEFAVHPGRNGWRPRLVFGGQTAVKWDAGESDELSLKKVLASDVEQWDAEHLARAISVLTTSVQRTFPNQNTFPLTPIRMPDLSALTDRPEHGIFWRAYNSMVSQEKDEAGWLDEVQKVTLSDLKSTALELLDTAIEVGR